MAQAGFLVQSSLRPYDVYIHYIPQESRQESGPDRWHHEIKAARRGRSGMAVWFDGARAVGILPGRGLTCHVRSQWKLT